MGSKKYLLALFLLWATTISTPPDFIFTEKDFQILVEENGISGKYQAMKASLSLDGKKLALSGRSLFNDVGGKLVPIKLYEVDIDYKLQFEKKYTPTTQIQNFEFLNSKKCFVVEMHTPDGYQGNIIQLDFSVDPAVKYGVDEPIITASPQILYKPSQNLVLISSTKYFKFYRMDGDVPIFPIAGASPSYNEAFLNIPSDITIMWAKGFNPDEASTELFLGGPSGYVGFVDTSRLAEETPTLDQNSFKFSGKLNEITPALKYIDKFFFFNIEYNHGKTTEMLGVIASGSTGMNALGLYIGFESDTIVSKGYVDNGYIGQTGSIGDIRNIIKTDYFICLFIKFGNLINTQNKIAIVDVGNIASDGIIDTMLLTDKIIPGELNEAFPIFIERVDSENGIWILGGGSGVAAGTEEANRGWYKVIELDPPYRQKCSNDCATCVEEYKINPLNCLTCSDSTRIILGPSGCRCSQNCVSCSENENFEKCRACAKGHFLKDENDDGEGECTEGEKNLGDCTTEKASLNNEKITLGENIEKCSSEKTTLTNEKKTLEDKIKELESGNGENSGKSPQSQNTSNPPYTKINGVVIPGCVSANTETGLCKSCARGYAKDTINEDEDATSCVWCGVEGCDYCRMRNGDGKRVCVGCLRGMDLIEENGVQKCFCYFLGVKCFFAFLGFFFILEISK